MKAEEISFRNSFFYVLKRIINEETITKLRLLETFTDVECHAITY